MKFIHTFTNGKTVCAETKVNENDLTMRCTGTAVDENGKILIKDHDKTFFVEFAAFMRYVENSLVKKKLLKTTFERQYGAKELPEK